MQRTRFVVVLVTVVVLLVSSNFLLDVVVRSLFPVLAEWTVVGLNTNRLFSNDALHIILCGTGSPIVDATRASSCTAIVAGGTMYLVDTGPQSTENLLLWRLPLANLSGIFLTHFHSDHIGDLGEVITQSWISGRSQPVTVYGPEGVSNVTNGFKMAYQYDVIYRDLHHNLEKTHSDRGEYLSRGASFDHTLPVSISIDEPSTRSTVVLEKNGLKVVAFEVNHYPVKPAYGYRFDYKGRSVVISGDTTASEVLESNSRNVDVIVHEAVDFNFVKEISGILKRSLLCLFLVSWCFLHRPVFFSPRPL
eukprot:TRINITY_DN574_c0_g1_i1.p1 TRINITY_DN574_c0_g1~~TRINITY_DN574_c0_g1_i1.p1  ORF type:complete len:306 (-),score=25.73 TRINITY_DN574_c0_g1_i1:676-1593(-)